MIRHVVMFKFKEEAEGRSKGENLALTKAMLEKLPSVIPQIRFQQVALNSDAADPSNYDLSLICDFDSFDDLHTYIVHPDHQAVGAFMRPLRTDRACVDYELN